MRMRGASLVLSGLLLVWHAHAAAPQTQVGTWPRTIEDVDRLLKAMRASVWTVADQVGNPAPDPDGRSIQDDIDAYLMTDEVLRALDEARARLPASAAPDGAIPDAGMQEMNLLAWRELCRFDAVRGYWSRDAAFADRHTLIKTLLGRLPDVPGDFAAEFQAVASQAEWTRSMLEDDLQACGTMGPDAAPSHAARMRAIASRYDVLRARLAAEVDRAVADGRLPLVARERDRSCPQIPPVAPAQDRKATVRSIPDPTEYYPEALRRQATGGIVRVRVVWDAGGCVTRAAVVSTSGSDELDAAAMRLALDMEMDPEIVEGKPVGADAVLPVRFGEQPEENAQPQP